MKTWKQFPSKHKKIRLLIKTADSKVLINTYVLLWLQNKFCKVGINLWSIQMWSLQFNEQAYENDLFDLKEEVMPAAISTYILDVLWCQPIKLIQVVSTSEFHEYWWKDVDFIFFVPSIYCRASEVTT